MSEDKNHDYLSGGLRSKNIWNISWEDLPKHQILETFQWWLRVAILVSLRGCKDNEDPLETPPRKHFLDRFESTEGESTIDTLGSIATCAFNRAILKECEGVTSLADITNLIWSEIKQSTKIFNFLIVEEFGDLHREIDREAGPLPNIIKLHSFCIFKQDLIGKSVDLFWMHCSKIVYWLSEWWCNCTANLQMVSDIDDIKPSEETENFYKVTTARQIKLVVTNPQGVIRWWWCNLSRRYCMGSAWTHLVPCMSMHISWGTW